VSEDRLVSVAECATLINRSAKYIQNNVRSHPTWFPPVIKASKRSPIEFRMSDIQSWISGLPTQQRALKK